jgi:hypothetical protein
MTTIPLPLDRLSKLYAAGLPLGLVCLSLMCQIALPWRLAAAAVLLLSGILLWWRYLRRRPASLIVEKDGRLCCMLANGHSLEVARILPGIIRPSLASARLEGRAGECCDLFVPGGSLPETAHWQLRRALVGLRPVQADERRGT